MLIDEFMPVYDFGEAHAVSVRATPERIFRAIKEVTPSEVRLARALFGLRSLPARLMGKRGTSLVTSRPLLEQLQHVGFVVLAEAPGRELVLGTIGQFWKAAGGSALPVAGAREFLVFDRAGYAKAVLSFGVEADSEGMVRVRTETRVQLTDPGSRRKFAFYWRLIYPGSALIRRMWLRAIKGRAERGSLGRPYA